MIVASAGRSTPGKPPEHRMRRDHRRAGMAGAEERVGAPVGHGLRGDADRRLRLAAQRRGRGFLHLDAVGSIGDLDVEPGCAGMPRQLAFDGTSCANQQQTDLKMTRGHQRPADDAGRGLVAAHRVNGDAQCAAASYQLPAARQIMLSELETLGQLAAGELMATLL